MQHFTDRLFAVLFWLAMGAGLCGFVLSVINLAGVMAHQGQLAAPQRGVGGSDVSQGLSGVSNRRVTMNHWLISYGERKYGTSSWTNGITVCHAPLGDWVMRAIAKHQDDYEHIIYSATPISPEDYATLKAKFE